MIINDFAPFSQETFSFQISYNSQLVSSLASELDQYQAEKSFCDSSSHKHLAKLRNDYPFSYCDKQRNKENPYETQFINTSDSLEVLKYHIKKGCAIAPCQFKNGKREKKNAKRFGLVIIDIDNSDILRDENGKAVKDENGKVIKIYKEQLTLEQIEKHPLDKYFAVYTSVSHTSDWNRLRLIGFLPVDVEGMVYEEILKLLNPLLNYAIDKNAMEAGRQFFGNTSAEFHNWENVQMLPYKLVKLAKEQAEKVKIEQKEKREKQLQGIEVNIGNDSEIKEAVLKLIPEIPPRQKGTGTYNYYRNLVWGLCSLYTIESGIKPDDDRFEQELLRVEEILEDSPLQSNRSQGWQSAQIIRAYDPTREGQNGVITSKSIFESFIELTGLKIDYKHLYKSNYEFIDPELGKVTATGEAAIARAKESIINLTEEEIAEFFTDYTAKKPKKEFTHNELIAWIKKKRRNYYKSQVNKRLKPDVREHSRYCHYEKIKKSLPVDYWGILNLVAPKGTGKSTMLGSYYYDEDVNFVLPDKESLINDFQQKGYNIISLSLRIALCEEQSHRWNLKFINSDSSQDKYKFATESNDIALVIDSLLYLKDRNIDDKLVIVFDEIKSFISHLLTSSTLKENRHLILKDFEKLLKFIYDNKGLIVLSDADLSQNETDYFQNISKKVNGGLFPTFTYLNTFKHKGREIYFFEHESDLFTLIHNLIEQNKRLIIPCDSIQKAQALEQILYKDFPNKNIFCINSESVADDDLSREFVTKPNESVKTLQPDVLLYTNSMGMGVSIDVPNSFDYVVCLADGTLTPSGVRQAIWRYRELVPILLYCPKQSHRYSPEIPLNVIECHQRIQKLSEGSIKVSRLLKTVYECETDYDYHSKMMSLFDDQQCLNDPHLKQLAFIYATDNYEFENYRECILEQLRAENNLVITNQDEVLAKFNLAEIDNNFSQDTKTQISENKKNHGRKVSQSSDITLEDAQELNKRSHLTPEQRLQIKKAFLKHRFGALADDPDFCYFATRDSGKNLNKIVSEFFCQNLEISRFYDRKAWRDFDYKIDNGNPLLTDVKQYSHRAKLLKNLRIFQFLAKYQELVANINPNDPNTVYPTVENLILPLRKRLLRYQKQIKDRFGLTFHKNTDTAKFLGYLLKQFGYELKVDKITGVVSIKNLSSKGLDDENAFTKYRSLIHQALLSKYEKDYAEAQKHNPYSNISKNVILSKNTTTEKNKNMEVNNFDFFDRATLKNTDIYKSEPSALPTNLLNNPEELVTGKKDYIFPESEEEIGEKIPHYLTYLLNEAKISDIG